jgi:hypothetical protein
MPRAKLYSLSVSHPSHAARLMLERKGIDHRVVNIQPGLHPLVVRLAGFRGGTVPALRIDGRRIQGSLRISRGLDHLQPQPPLFPATGRDAVEAAEAWGERELQPVPRRMYRWGLGRNATLRRRLAELSPIPGAGIQTVVNQPIARLFAGMIGADDATVERDVRELLSFQDVAPMIQGRPAEALALRLLPEWPDEVPPFLPERWLAQARDRGAATPGAHPA